MFHSFSPFPPSFPLSKNQWSPGQFGSAIRVSALRPKSLDSSQGHVSQLRFGPLPWSESCRRQPIDVSFLLFPSLPLYLKRDGKIFSGLASVAQWLSIDPCTRRSPVQFPVRAHAQVVGQIPSGGHAGGGQSMFSVIDVSVSLSPFLFLQNQ
uniref:Uncharacterized protein n=1 Tax=Molossus molossus TaxID=27622 RepID=A0A7J8FYS5_MOLMO|nr:hypothetical protein HJG59_008245 [Molossus molossus]